MVQPGHHTPEVVGLIGRVAKHGYPCRHRVECLVEFPQPVFDKTFAAERFCHYIRFKDIKKL